MTGPETPATGGPRDGPGRQDHIEVWRAVVLLVTAVVAGVLLLHVATEPTATTAATTTSTTAVTTTTSAATHHATTTTAPKPNPAVMVLVGNGSTTTGAAGYFTTKLKGDGWSTLAPVTASAASTSAVYYAAGQNKAADAVAKDLGLSASAVQPLTSSVAVPGATAASVVVVIGADLAGQVPATTTTT